MSLTSSVSTANHELRMKEVTLAVVPTAGTAYVTGGDTLDLTAATNPKFIPDAQMSNTAYISTAEVIASPPGFTGKLVAGTTLANWKLLIEENAAGAGAFAEIPQANYPAGCAGATFTCRFRGPKGRL